MTVIKLQEQKSQRFFKAASKLFTRIQKCHKCITIAICETLKLLNYLIHFSIIYGTTVPSVHWRCWLGGRKGARAVKKTELWGAGMNICLERGADLHMAQLMPLPLAVPCFSKIQIVFIFLVPAHPSSPGQRAVKRVCVFMTQQWSALIINYIKVLNIWSTSDQTCSTSLLTYNLQKSTKTIMSWTLRIQEL